MHDDYRRTTMNRYAVALLPMKTDEMPSARTAPLGKEAGAPRTAEKKTAASKRG
jgi:hypothetical protein